MRILKIILILFITATLVNDIFRKQETLFKKFYLLFLSLLIMFGAGFFDPVFINY